MTEIDIGQLIKILPQLIRDNDSVKGAILTALSGVVATREDIKDLIREMDKRFESVDKRFEAVDKRFEAVDKRFDDVKSDLTELKVAVGSIGERSGLSLENAILELMKEQLLKEKINYKYITRETLVDKSGEIFWKGYSTDIDIVATNGEIHLFEIKYKADQRDAFHFMKNVELYERVHNMKPTKLFLVSIEITLTTVQTIAHLPIKIITGKVIT